MGIVDEYATQFMPPLLPNFMNDSSPSSPSTEAIVFQLSLLNQLSAIEGLNTWLEECAAALDLSSRGTFRLQLILEEIVMNIFENAYDDQGDHFIQIQLTGMGTAIAIRVEDDGSPFDPTSYPDRVLSSDTDNIEDVQIGGVGLHLVRSYADEYQYERLEDKNIFSLVFNDAQDRSQGRD